MAKIIGSKQVAKKSSSLDEVLLEAELELEDLMQKISKLEDFLNQPADGVVIPGDGLLVREQANAMQVYADRLMARINRFKSIRKCLVL